MRIDPAEAPHAIPAGMAQAVRRFSRSGQAGPFIRRACSVQVFLFPDWRISFLLVISPSARDPLRKLNVIEKISDLRLFKRIAELGTLTAAAGDIGISAGSASLRLATMERGVGTTLFRRTTRQMHLTEAGREFLEVAMRVLDELSDFDENIARAQQAVSGTIRITAPVDIGRNVIASAMDVFQDDNPGVSVDLICTDRVVDLTEQNIDIAVRYGALSDSSLRIRRLSSNRRIPVAAPSYLRIRGTPRHPRDLVRHDCILLSSSGDRNDTWMFVDQNKALPTRVHGVRSTNDGEILRRWAVQGKGIALKSAWDVANDITTGALVPLLAPYCAPNIDLQLVFQPANRHPVRVRRLADHLVRQLKALDDCLSRVDLNPIYEDAAPSSTS